ncbi:putative membrane protein YkoI [Nonomuraea thailandensis]|uniref:Membrane protein YkoI n=1 Tax=Nonomuraea thailandensis TaxID=1188745 RepID=A0A9X2K5S0_9ACTN|nr:PepSY domain-containing protein [Nonomuraea thailandensis]MCP2360804.1 putative membrane protein YkoI [Nonomuraea thailandensis]
MRITKKLIVAGIISLAATGGAVYATAAYASEAAETAAPAVAPKVTAEQAIGIALKEVPGSWVSELDFDSRGQQADAWELELTKGTERHEVDVDATSGKVTKQQADQDDDDQDDDGDDGDDD